MQRELYRTLAATLQAIKNCEASGNAEWLARHEASVEKLVEEHMPQGGGFDSGTTLDMAKSNPDKLVFDTSFHHMNECGMYDGWTEHTVIVTPSLANGFDMRVTGRDRNDIKDYIAESFSMSLQTLVND